MDAGRTRQLHNSSLSTNLATHLSALIAFLLLLSHEQAQEQTLLPTQDILAQRSTSAKDYTGDKGYSGDKPYNWTVGPVKSTFRGFGSQHQDTGWRTYW